MPRLPLLPAAAFVAALWFIGSFVSAASVTRPNVVLVMADDQSWGETGYNGHPHVQTPVLDAMARSGLRLDRFYAASPVCSPTRASVMTGRHANRSGAFAPNYSTRPEEITLAQVLQRAGYRTGHFGKWHLGAVKKDSPVNPARLGFDEYLSHDNFFEMNPPLSRNGEPPEIHRGEGSEIVAAAAEEFLRKVHKEGRPFFLVLWFGSPHGPYSGLASDVDRYASVPNEELRRRFAEITAMDRALGRFRTALRTLGVAEDTLLWYNSDNGLPREHKGLSFDGDWRGAKGEVYEGGLRVPGIIEWPAVIRQGRVTAVPCVTSDIFPTILDVLGLSSPRPERPLDGISLRPLIIDGTMTARPAPIGFWRYNAQAERSNGRWIDGELARGTTPTTRNPAIDFLNFKHPTAKVSDFSGDAAWTDNRYKLVLTEVPRPAAKARKRAAAGGVELFDLLADPKEQHNIAEAHPEVVRRMTEQLHAWQRSVERSLSGADY
ncbi:MAG: sulfatase-like hydrolase/transferase [Verrucomicrobia bacterium]|nr:sulfatase-like hydrolase/transferase [Verrucomicrobiota bacterium]